MTVENDYIAAGTEAAITKWSDAPHSALEQKNQELAALHVRDIAAAFTGARVVLADDPERRYMMFNKVVAFGKAEDGVLDAGTDPMYEELTGKNPLEAVVLEHSRKKSKILCIKAAGEHPTTCIYIQQAKIPNSDRGGKHKKTKAAQEVPNHFGLETGKLYAIGFEEDSEILTLREKNVQQATESGRRNIV